MIPLVALNVLLAHVGHWLVETLYITPVLVIVVWISIRSILDRRRERREAATPPPPPPPAPS